MKVNSLKGTRDYYPEVKRVQNYIFDNWKKVATKFGYEMYDGPMVEPAELWTEKAGDEIVSQLYAFEDKGGRLVTVRPDLTPTLARMVGARLKELSKPIKWFSIGEFWRYERAQKGRSRNFYQLNIDCLGVDSMKADAEIVAIAVEMVKVFGVDKDKFYIRLNNRKLIQDLIMNIVMDESLIQDVARLIDKKDKLEPKDFILALKDIGLDDNQIAELKTVLEMKTLDDVNEDGLSDLGKEGLQEMKDLLKYLEFYDVMDYIEVDLSLMRGFDYYTSTVLEVFDRGGKFRAIAGGGRYDNLVAQFSENKCSGLGFAMGDVVLELFLREIGKLPDLKQDVDYYVLSASDDVYEKSLEIANTLRKKYNVALDVMGAKFGKQMNYANKISAKNVVIVGEQELKDKVVKVKDMRTGAEKEVKLDEVSSL